ncbi:aldehyde dehydrogenase family protein [Rhizohabitans arisaemae]|uniref:aldehyde dehydrogenase family protein n=1 Tax=Rhizohabitans arisaemae TaxID=2720610 RepID=UPI0024B03D3E|nr:aldehyde dehydrogenase family protein [Rhizohabitans arisaemae]
MRDWRMLIGGDLVTGDRRYATENPATQEHLAEVPFADPRTVDAAVLAAHAAWPAWRRRAARDRADRVRALADLLQRHAGELARLDTLDTGVPLWMMRADLVTGLDRMRMFADWALLQRGETVPASAAGLHFTERVPYGVVARIIAYNHPAMFAISKIAAPLVAGNTVVLKPSELTPLSALRIGELAAEVLPPGTLSVVTGDGRTGDALVRHPLVRRIAFTGSQATGRTIQRGAAETGVKNVSLELGGKNALIVFPDADLELAAEGAVRGMNLAFAGQSCGSTSRLLAHPAIAGELTERIRARFREVRVGDPFRPGVVMGPLISAAHRDRVLGHIAAPPGDGTLVCGGVRPDGLDRGHFVSPALFTGVRPGSPLATDEIFGPVLSVLSFDTEQEATGLANDTGYGLTGAVYTADLGRAHRVARELEAGYVWVNDTSTHFPAMPFGGVKGSGLGREESLEELLDYTQVKTVNVVLR